MPRGPHEARAHGIRCLLSSHPAIRRLKGDSPPEIHGTRQWPSSWLLIDYLSRHPLPGGSRVIEVGAGWGLAGIYCAKRFGAEVLAVDKDPAVFPYLELHAELNGVEVRTLRSGFRGLTAKLLGSADAVIASDICFWKALIPEVRGLVLRAVRAGAGLVLVADPARSTFEAMAGELAERGACVVEDWRTARPRPMAGRILRAPVPLPREARVPHTARPSR
jgi:predicted nicotinamide N-methyase